MSNSRSHKSQMRDFRASRPQPEFKAPVRKIPLNIPAPDPFGPGKIEGEGTSTEPVGSK